MKLLVLDHSAAPGGAELALETFLRDRPKAWQITVMFEEEGLLPERIRDLGGVAVRTAPNGSSRAVPSIVDRASRLGSALRRTRKCAQDFGPDVVYSNTTAAGLYGSMAAGSLRVPHVWHVRDNLSRDSFDRVYLAMLRTALRRQQPELVVANSEWTKSQLPLSMRETASVIPSPSGCPSPDLPVVDRWPITTLAVIGRISDRKGQHVAIEALSRLDVTSPVQLRIVGDALFGETAYKEKLERMAGGLPRHKSVRFVGHTDDVWSEFARADVVIVPSVVPEPFGQVVVQAMATGRVVVGSNAGGPAEVITHDVDGLLFVPGSADGLAGCLSAVMRDLELRNRLRDEARRTASRYSSAHLSGRLARFLEAAAAMTR